MVDLLNFDVEQLFGLGEDFNPLLMLVWIVPIILFVFYGQRIQLHITSGEIKKGIKKLDGFRTEARGQLVLHAGGLGAVAGYEGRLDRFLDYFTVMPVDMDPAGIVDKVRHVVRSREDHTRDHIRSAVPGIGPLELGRVQTLLEIASTLQMLYKVINHLYLTAKKQNNYPLILPLQMLLPTILEQAEAMREAIPAFRAGQPVGDGIGPMVVGRMMAGLEKEKAAFETVLARTEHAGRKLVLVKAEGPASTVGRPADALEAISAACRIDAIVMVDAALKMEGEDSATIAEGFGAAIGGIGTERFQIEEVATKNKIPIFSVIVRQSIKEAIALMTRDIADRADGARERVMGIISDNTSEGQTVVVIGVGNTSGVGQ